MSDVKRVGILLEATDKASTQVKKVAETLEDAYQRWGREEKERVARSKQVGDAFTQQTRAVVEGTEQQKQGISQLAIATFTGIASYDLFVRALNLVAVGLRGTVAFLGDSIKQSIEAEKANRNLAGALFNTGQYSLATLQALQQQSDALARVATAGNSAITTVQQIGIDYGLSANEIGRFTRAALDLATAMDKDLISTAKALGKAVQEGTTRALAGMGVEFGKVKIAAGDANSVLKIVEANVGGRAQAELQSFGARLAEISERWDDLQQAVGDVITQSPALQMVLMGVENVLNAVKDAVSRNKVLLSGLAVVLADVGIMLVFGVGYWAGLARQALNAAVAIQSAAIAFATWLGDDDIQSARDFLSVLKGMQAGFGAVEKEITDSLPAMVKWRNELQAIAKLESLGLGGLAGAVTGPGRKPPPRPGAPAEEERSDRRMRAPFGPPLPPVSDRLDSDLYFGRGGQFSLPPPTDFIPAEAEQRTQALISQMNALATEADILDEMFAQGGITQEEYATRLTGVAAEMEKLSTATGKATALTDAQRNAVEKNAISDAKATGKKQALTTVTNMLSSAFSEAAGAAIYAAISGEKAHQRSAKAVLGAIAQQAIVQALFELGMGFAALAAHDAEGAALHFAAAKIFGAVGGAAAVATRALGGGNSGGSRGTRGGTGGSTRGATALADGGIVDRPTYALIGEAGREAVIPLDSPRGRDALGGMGEPSITIVININGDNWAETGRVNSRTIEQLVEAVSEGIRRGILKPLPTKVR